MAAGSPDRTSPLDLARRVVRSALSGSVRAAAGPLRALARAGRADTDPRWAGTAWLWQPGWGKGCHDRLYRRPNPYGIDANDYEQQKYDRVVEALAGRRFGRVLEVGCGEGDLSERLAGHTDDLVGVDISDAAVARARHRVPSATFETRTLPGAMPEGTFDLIVCTDVLYYWEPVTLRVGLDRLLERLRPGGMLLAYHYRGDFGQIGTADAVHALLRGHPGTRGTVREDCDGVGPGRVGALFDVVTAPPADAVAVPAQRSAPVEAPPTVAAAE
ncbi:trans-aconitate 2-methyltransferase [Pseudonocardia sp. KRD291]|uniref:class I SAM-dependent methyltransferase n=1 Tax=Pseudonocardia sp. KRD291 TaxID=2792007 RepID=UPI001C49F1DC|nr:class I SAM-dependent methyltransferase [Pseudonocardia sp. KRD291]MBW0101205.1 methyltransferase domain-containing protein [Pseudonocardia sp. KRD291]